MSLADNTWFFAFTDRPDQPWYMRPLEPGYRHCFAFHYDPDHSRWHVLDWGSDTLSCKILTRKEVDAVIARATFTGRILKYDIPEKRDTRFLGFMSCVGAMKRLACINDFRIQTPYAFHAALVKRGAIPYFGTMPLSGDN